jgi:hypothetical protein
MNLSFNEQKNIICKYIDYLSARNGGDEREWLENYKHCIIHEHMQCLGKLLIALEDIAGQEGHRAVREDVETAKANDPRARLLKLRNIWKGRV